MSTVYKFLGTEISISSANTVNSSKLIRVVNTANALSVLTVANSTATYANTTLVPYEAIIVEKANTADTVAGSNLRAVQIAYRN